MEVLDDMAVSLDSSEDALPEGHDGAPDLAHDTTPIGAPNDTWTWVDFPDSKCANGSATGIAVNPHEGATSTLIWFQGGGSCYSYETCWGASPTATYLTGYSGSTFNAAMPSQPILQRAQSGNPFAAMNYVWVPYCTGDLHSGTASTTLTSATDSSQSMKTYFWGALDTDLFLARLVPTFPSQERIWIAGGSAGGFGTFMSFPRIVSAFGVEADIIDDSGPPLVEKSSTTGNNATLFTTWGTTAGLPGDCAGCNSFMSVLDYDLAKQQTFTTPGEYAFLSFEEDCVIAPDFGYDPVTEYPMVMTNFSMTLASHPHTATFLVTGYESHVVQNSPQFAVDYLPWLTNMVNRSASWTSTVQDAMCTSNCVASICN